MQRAREAEQQATAIDALNVDVDALASTAGVPAVSVLSSPALPPPLAVDLDEASLQDEREHDELFDLGALSDTGPHSKLTNVCRL